MFLWLTSAQVNAIVEHAQREAPSEACGLIGGVGMQAQQVVPIHNIATNPQVRYQMEQSAFVKAMYGFENAGMSLIGIYHSHPNSDPIPSPTDIHDSHYPDTPYLIVSLKRNHPAFAAWRIYRGRVQRVHLHVGNQPPEIEPETSLSGAQKAAILLSAIIAFMLMLTISLSLLPPAPPLPVR